MLRFASPLALVLASAGLSLQAQEAPAPPAVDAATPVDRVDHPDKVGVLLVGGANNHDWQWTHESIARILRETGRFEVTVTTEPGKTLADAEALKAYDVFLLDYNGPRWGEPAEQNFLTAVKGGTGVVVVHAANNAFPGWVEFEEMVMLLWRKGTGHGRFHPFDVEVVDADHPVTRGMPNLVMHPDELYHRLVNSQNVETHVLAHAFSSKESGGTGRHEPMVLVRKYGEGRIFHTPLGHVWKNVPASRVSHVDPQFRRLLARGTEWAATGACTLSPIPPNWVSPEERALGFERIFNGRNADGWRGYRKEGFPEQGWSVEDGALVLGQGGGGGDLVTTEEYGNFELRFEWAVAKKSNSGVIYRVGEDQPTSYMTGPEFQVLDDQGHGLKPDAPTATGALYGLAPAQNKVIYPAGFWNEGRIVVEGWHIQHWVNGVKVVDVDLDDEAMREQIAASKFAAWPFASLDRGHIALQDHGNAVRYRSLRVRRLNEPKQKEDSDK